MLIFPLLLLFSFTDNKESKPYLKANCDSQRASDMPFNAIKSTTPLNNCFYISAHDWQGMVYAHATNRCSYQIKVAFEVKWWNGSSWVLLKGFGGTKYQYAYLEANQSKLVVEQRGTLADYKITPISEERY